MTAINQRRMIRQHACLHIGTESRIVPRLPYFWDRCTSDDAAARDVQGDIESRGCDDSPIRTSPRFVGRTAELDRLIGIAAAVSEGARKVLLISGAGRISPGAAKAAGASGFIPKGVALMTTSWPRISMHIPAHGRMPPSTG